MAPRETKIILRVKWDDEDPSVSHPAGWDWPVLLDETRDSVTLLDFEDKDEDE